MASSSQIKPGEKGKITAAVDVRNYNGAVIKHIIVRSNDPLKPQAVLQLKAEVRRDTSAPKL